jgi:uncharacterized protein YndB with AHSA1/START domain
LDHEIEVAAEIAAPPARVFAAWTEGELVKDWWKDPNEFRTVGFTSDLRVDGAWKIEFAAIDGNRFCVEGVYRGVARPNHLSFTWKPEWDEGEASFVEMQFLQSKSGTAVAIEQHGIATSEEAGANIEAWEKALGWLKAYLERA